MNSAFYEGWVRHRRFLPRPNTFRYRIFLPFLDLGELDRVFEDRWLWSCRRPALQRFRRRDYLGDPGVPLDEAVRDLVASRTGRRPGGPVRLLANLHSFGYTQNPVAFYYCFSGDGKSVDAIAAEITNTPWGERHAYVFDARERRAEHPGMRFRFRKEFHVSPFLGMAQDYDWRFTAPGRTLAVHMRNLEGRACHLDSTMMLERRAIDSRSCASMLLRHPFPTHRIAFAIYFQALKLKWRGCPFHVHPKHQQA